MDETDTKPDMSPNDQGANAAMDGDLPPKSSPSDAPYSESSPFSGSSPAMQRLEAAIHRTELDMRRLALRALDVAKQESLNSTPHLESPADWDALLDAAMSADKRPEWNLETLQKLQHLASSWRTAYLRLSYLTRSRPIWNT